MVVVIKLMGGLGNQMFQYAFGEALARRIGTRVRYDLSFFEERGVLGIEVTEATKVNLSGYQRLRNPRTRVDRLCNLASKKRIYVERGPRYDLGHSAIRDGTYCEGYFQDERYFADVAGRIRDLYRIDPYGASLAPECLELGEEISRGQSVCLHVRRGDYVDNPENVKLFGSLPTGYYLRGMDHVRSRTGGRITAYVFSNDVPWCRESFLGLDDVVVVDEALAGPDGTWHFWLMTRCRHFVIAASSFSWWAAWLADSPDKVVCRPDPWFVKEGFNAAEVCPDSWARISRE